MKVKTALRAGGIAANHARKLLKVRTKVKAAGLAVTNHNRAPAPHTHAWEVTRRMRLGIPETQSQAPLVPLIRCANRTKAGEPCGVCWYCKRHDEGKPNSATHDFDWELPF